MNPTRALPSRRSAGWLRASAVALVLVGTGCEADPIATDLDNWYYGLSAVLVENASLAHKIQELAAEVNKDREKDKVSAKDTAGKLTASIVPLAQLVAEHAADVRPQTAEFQGMHDNLASLWTDRAESYAGILAAWETADADALATGTATVRDIRIAEAFWFTRTNEVLEPKGYRFEEFPRSAPTRASN
jgi:hypothetical protein